mgnify:CR=1 FL=1
MSNNLGYLFKVKDKYDNKIYKVIYILNDGDFLAINDKNEFVKINPSFGVELYEEKDTKKQPIKE